MDLDKIGIVARQRTAWEAVDLGVLLARRWYRPLLLGWMLPSLAVFLLLSLLFQDSLWIAFTITWWLKPLWDQIPLTIASRALFGEKPTLKLVWVALRALWKRDWFAWLTWRRFSPTRSFDMPVTVLEGLKGQVRHKRLNILHINTSGAATLLTMICVHLELALTLGVIGVVYLFIPEEVDFNLLGLMQSEAGTAEFVGNAITYFAMVAVAPFYTTAGFALYISRRIELEGWDIEIRFRHMAERLQSTGSAAANETRAKAVGLRQLTIGVLLLPVLFSWPLAGQAAPQQEEPEVVELSAEAKAAREDIAKVLQGEDFGREVTRKTWRFKNAEEMAEEDQVPEWLIRLVEFLEKYLSSADEEENGGNWLGAMAAKGLEFFLWVVAILLFIFLVVHYREYLQSFARVRFPAEKRNADAPQIMFGLDVREESLPENIPQQVLELWRNGEGREALGLLYRATLSRLVHQYHFKFSESATESECAEIVNRSGWPELNEYLQRLTRTWQRLAYGHRMPGEDDVIRLCDGWQGVFHRES